MAPNELVAQLKEKIQVGLEFKDKDLVSRPEWGSITFDAAQEDLDRIFSVLGHLAILPIEKLTDQAVRDIQSSLDQVIQTFEAIDKFSIEVSNPPQTRDSLVQQVHQRADQFYTHASPWIPFLAYERGDVEKNIAALTESVEEAKSLIAEAKKEVEEQKGEIDGIVTAAREASAAAGAAVFTEDFEKTADALEAEATVWLRRTALFALGTVLLALFVFFFAESGLDTGELIQKSAARLAVLAILFTATVWCGRMYKALLHQEAVNRHRALSLQTFQAFSHAASDNGTKDAVLMEATRAVFGAVPTGFLDKESSRGQGLQIVEFAKRLSEESSS